MQQNRGLLLWANSVLPSLLPFFIATELLSYTNIIPLCGRLLSPIMKPIFNVPGEGAFAFLMGIISGYPVGAKIVANLKEQNVCTNIEAERLISFTNNSGPLFIIGTVGIGFFSDTRIGFILLISHILAGITTGFLFRFWKKFPNVAKGDGSFWQQNCQKEPSPLATISFCNLGEALSKSIINAINTVLMIGGFIVLFSIFISMLQTCHLLDCISNAFIKEFVIGLIEVTNGLANLSKISSINSKINLSLCSFILGFGGLSVLLQVLSITSKVKISIKPYVIGKLLQACFAAFYTYLII